MIKLHDKIVWRNKNTNTIESGKVRSINDDKIAIGDHYVSWLMVDDIEVLETKNDKQEQKNSNNYNKRF